MARKVREQQNSSTPPSERTYFKSCHWETELALVSWREDPRKDLEGTPLQGKLYITYRLSDGSDHRCPRGRIKWLDGRSKAAIKAEMDRWMKEHNSGVLSARIRHIPDYYAIQKPAFIKYCLGSAEASTVKQYIQKLEDYVFPYFDKELSQAPSNWSSSYKEWREWLREYLKSSSSRDHCVTALRQYLGFLEEQGDQPQRYVLPKFEKQKSKNGEGRKKLPGTRLPDDKEMLRWLRKLPPGRERWLITVMAAFGVRISEAWCIEKCDIYGRIQADRIKNTAPFLDVIIKNHSPALLLNVSQADKNTKIPAEIAELVEEEDDSLPKSGPYVAVCLSKEIATFLLELLRNKENRMPATRDTIRKVIKNSSTKKIFRKYTPHDFRRWHETWCVLTLQNFFICARIHGQKTEAMARRYYQYGLEMARTTFKDEKIELIS